MTVNGTETVRARDRMLNECWVLSPAVALRPEPFGAMAYHFGNRKLTFLKKPELVRVVRSLEESPTVRDALVNSKVPESHWNAYLAALHGLAATDMICSNEGQIAHD